MTTILIAFFVSGDIQKQVNHFVDYSTEWQTENGEEAKLSKISGEYVIHTTLPEVKKGDALYFNFKTLNVEIFRGEECVYQTPSFEKRLFGKTPGSYFVEIPLSEQDAGTVVTVKLNNPYDDESGKIPQILFGSQEDILMHQIGNRLPGFCISLIITFLGVAFIAMFLLFYWRQMVGREMLYIGLFAFGMGVFMVTDCKFLQIISPNAHFYHMIAEMFMMLIISPLLLFLGKMYKAYPPKTVLLVCVVSSICFVISFVLNITGVKDYHEMVSLTHFTYAVAIVCIIIGIVRSLRENKKEYISHNIGVLGICVAAIIDILMLNFGTSMETTFFTRMGVLLYMCLEGVELLMKIFRQYREMEKNKLLSRLAYHDGLTDLLNRTSFMEEIQRLEDENCENVLLAIFDVNNLKQVNDNYGHAKGDDLIVTVGQSIKTCFEALGKCYRTGGDEFIIIGVGEQAEETFCSLSVKFYQTINQINERKEFPMEIKVALGYCITHAQEQQGLHSTLEMADARMYENKKKLKAM